MAIDIDIDIDIINNNNNNNNKYLFIATGNYLPQVILVLVDVRLVIYLDNGNAYKINIVVMVRLMYITESALKINYNTDIKNQRIAISGSGNVALYAAEKILELGGIMVQVFNLKIL